MRGSSGEGRKGIMKCRRAGCSWGSLRSGVRWGAAVRAGEEEEEGGRRGGGELGVGCLRVCDSVRSLA